MTNHLRQPCVLLVTHDRSSDKAARVLKDALHKLQQRILLAKRQSQRQQPPQHRGQPHRR